MKHKFCIKFGC